MDCARRVESDHDIDATPQEAAWQLIELSEEYLSTPSRPLPEAVRTYLCESFRAILDGKPADVALGIRATKGRAPLDDRIVSTVIAHFVAGIRNGLTPADAKAATLNEAEKLWVGGRTKDWLDDLLDKHQDMVKALILMSDAELAAMADFEYLKDQDHGIK